MGQFIELGGMGIAQYEDLPRNARQPEFDPFLDGGNAKIGDPHIL